MNEEQQKLHALFTEMLSSLEEAVVDETLAGLSNPKLPTPASVVEQRNALIDVYTAAIVTPEPEVDSDLAAAIGEHAFKAGFGAGMLHWSCDGRLVAEEHRATYAEAEWSAYTPPEELCGVVLVKKQRPRFCVVDRRTSTIEVASFLNEAAAKDYTRQRNANAGSHLPWKIVRR